MRSFSILVIAWFFACIVSVRGEELDGTLKGVFMPRLRYNHKRMVLTMPDQIELSAGSDSRPGTQGFNSSNPHKITRKGNVRKDRGVSPKSFNSIRTKVLNAFYPPLGVFSTARKYKYATSHYEVNLGIVGRLNSTASAVDEAFYAELNASALNATIKLGGPEFHNAVRQAAFKANKEFLVDASAVSIDALCGVFYAILYNSRQLYSLLCTALRCQNMVNAVDEDGVYLNPIFSKHSMQMPTLDANNTTPISEGWQSYVGLNVMASLNARHSNSYVTFSDPVSNAWWNQLWGNAMNYIRLPRKWMDWCEKMFSYVHLVEPTDSGIYPKFVVFWPDSKFIKYDTINQVSRFDFLSTYIQPNPNSIFVDNASLITDLAPYIDEVATFFNAMLQVFPQLEIMFNELNCSYSHLTLDIQRDITARTVRLNRSYTIEKLIYTAALPFYVVMDPTHGSIETYRTDYARRRTEMPACWVTLDPKLQNNQLIKGERVEISRATFSYTTYAEFSELDYILLNSNIAPLSWESFSDMQINNVRQLRYISAPLMVLSEYGNALDDIVVSNVFTSTYMLQTIVTAFDDLFHVKSNLKVLPRISASVDDLGNPITAGETTLLEYGYYPIVLGANYALDQEFNLSLRDYLVPALVQAEAIDSYVDFLATV